MAEVHTKNVPCAFPCHISSDVVNQVFVVRYQVPVDKTMTAKAPDQFASAKAADDAKAAWLSQVAAAPVKVG